MVSNIFKPKEDPEKYTGSSEVFKKDQLWGWGKNSPSPCPVTSHILSFDSHTKKVEKMEEVINLLSCSCGLKISEKHAATEQPGSLSSQSGRSEYCQRLLAPSLSLKP